jgi:hypothetical protein
LALIGTLEALNRIIVFARRTAFLLSMIQEVRAARRERRHRD